MTDAELIYNALLRTERRLEEGYGLAEQQDGHPAALLIAKMLLSSVTIIREEIGRGINDAYPG